MKTGGVRADLDVAIVRRMAERTKRTIRAEDVQGVKHLRRLGRRFLGSAREEWSVTGPATASCSWISTGR